MKIPCAMAMLALCMAGCAGTHANAASTITFIGSEKASLVRFSIDKGTVSDVVLDSHNPRCSDAHSLVLIAPQHINNNTMYARREQPREPEDHDVR